MIFLLLVLIYLFIDVSLKVLSLSLYKNCSPYIDKNHPGSSMTVESTPANQGPKVDLRYDMKIIHTWNAELTS